jgi:cytochrome c-type biogenesis protein CcsB
MTAEQLAYNAFLTGFVFTAIATVCYAALPLWPRVVYRTAVAEPAGTMTIADRSQPPAWLGPAASAALWLAVVALTLSLGARWVAAGRPPYANMWEFTIGFGWGILLWYGLFEQRLLQQRDGSSNGRAVGVFVLPIALTMFAVSLAFFPSNLYPLMPALQANRILGAHVATMMLSYAALSVSFGAAVIYLLQGEGKQPRFSRLPSGSVLEEVANRSVLVGFPMLALGIALGAYWGNMAWGRYWGWDAKETSALVTWLIYAGYLHARNLRGWRGNRAAWLLVVGFAAVLFTYFVVNLVPWIPGLHTYAGV